MKKPVCDICGSTQFLKKDDIFTCKNCGTEYDLTSIKKIIKDVEDEPVKEEPKNQKKINSRPEPIFDEDEDDDEDEKIDEAEDLDEDDEDYEQKLEDKMNEETNQMIKKNMIHILIALAIGLLGIQIFTIAFGVWFIGTIFFVAMFFGFLFTELRIIRRRKCPKCKQAYDYDRDVSYEEIERGEKSFQVRYNQKGKQKCSEEWAKLHFECECNKCGHVREFNQKYVIAEQYYNNPDYYWVNKQPEKIIKSAFSASRFEVKKWQMILFYIISVALLIGSIVTMIITFAGNSNNSNNNNNNNTSVSSYVGTYYGYTDTANFKLVISNEDTNNGKLITNNYVYDTLTETYNAIYLSSTKLKNDYIVTSANGAIALEVSANRIASYYIKSKNPLQLESESGIIFTKTQKSVKEVMNDPMDYYGTYQATNTRYEINSDYTAKAYASATDTNPISYKYIYANNNYVNTYFSKNGPALILYNDSLVSNKRAICLVLSNGTLTDSNSNTYNKTSNSSSTTSATGTQTTPATGTQTTPATGTQTTNSTTYTLNLANSDLSSLSPTEYYYSTNDRSNVENETNILFYKFDGCAVTDEFLISCFEDGIIGIYVGDGEVLLREGVNSQNYNIPFYYLKNESDATLTQANNPLCLQIKRNGIVFNVTGNATIEVEFTAAGTSGRAIGLKKGSSYVKASKKTSVNSTVYYEGSDNLYYNNSSLSTSTSVTGAGTNEGYILTWQLSAGTYTLYSTNQMRIYSLKITETK